MKKIICKLFKKTQVQKNVIIEHENYNINTLSNLYFPGIAQEIAKQRKVRNFFENLNTEC